MERIKIGDNGHKLSLKQRLVRYLLKDAHIDELHIGAHSIVIDSDVIKMNALAADPGAPAEGWMWYLAGAVHKPRHCDNVGNKDIGEGAAPGAHDLGGAEHNADTLANLNAKVSDATLDKNTDKRDPNAHATDHQSGGGDELDLTGMKADTLAEKTLNAGVNIDTCLIKDGKAADSSLLEGSNKATVQTHAPAAHNLGGAEHNADTLANLNAKVSDATLDDSSATRDPNSHDRTKHSDIDQSLLTTDNVGFAQVTVGDLVLKNGYRFTEHKKYGVCLKSPKGKLYRLMVERC